MTAGSRLFLRPRILIATAAVVAAVVLAVALFLGVAEEPVPPPDPQYTSTETERVTLLDAFESYDSIVEVTQRLQAAGMQWKAEQSHLPPVRGRPPYNFDTLTVDGSRHLGAGGSIVLEFFNDRLYSATFRPADASTYLARLRKQNHHLERTHVSVWEAVEGNLRISSNADFAVSTEGRQLDTPLYITWEDIRLSEQIRRWYDTYGRKPLTPD